MGDLACMNAIDAHFGQAKHILCNWHIQKQVLANWKKHYLEEASFLEFQSLWTTVMNSNTQEEYKKRLA